MFDVEKAYDRADIDDMLYIAWKDGVKGKLWRLTRELNTELTASIKTKHGNTRTIKRESGGKQGGKTIVTLFSRLMDELTWEMSENEKVGINIDNKEINNLLFVDDALTIAEGRKQQEETLKSVNDFAIKHKIKWGTEKCKVLEIGGHSDYKEKWKLGNQDIEGAETYKYLGDYINRKGTNKENIEERLRKVKLSTREIITYGTSSTMRKLQSRLLIELHETISVPSLLNNSESWLLGKTDLIELEKIEIWGLKRLLNLPPKTPTAAVRYETGTLFVEIRIDQRQLMYLHKVLQRNEHHWTRHILKILNEMDLGWSEEINKKLKKYELDTDWSKVTKYSTGEWKNRVKQAVQKENQRRLLSLCFKDRNVEKTKTKYLVSRLQENEYEHNAHRSSLNLTRLQTKAIIMARSGMLECAANYKNGYRSNICKECKMTDDENHRINECTKYTGVNYQGQTEKFDFCDVYSDTKEVLQSAAHVINKVWDLVNGKNSMRLLNSENLITT